MSPLRGHPAEDRGSPRPGGSGLAARAERLTKVYGSGDTEVAALRGVDLDFPRGRFTAIMGPSGSGKSTLMHCLAGLDTVSGGRVFIGDVELSRLSDRALTQLRRDRIGFIFQQFNLLPTLTAAENITLPLDIAGRKPDKKWMKLVIDAVGLAPRLNHRPTELSGGQQQRVACARALITRPDIIFGDEPTGNLDSASGAEVLSFLADSVRELGQTVVMVTHDAKAASYADEVVFLADGRIVDTMLEPTADAVLDRMKNLDQLARGRRGTSPPRAAAGGDDNGRAGRRVPTGPSGTRADTAAGTRRATEGGTGARRATGGARATGAGRGGAGGYAERTGGDLPRPRPDAGGYPPARRGTGPAGGYRAADPAAGEHPPARPAYREPVARRAQRQPTGGERGPRGRGGRYPDDGYAEAGYPGDAAYGPRGGYDDYGPGEGTGAGGEPARDAYRGGAPAGGYRDEPGYGDDGYDDGYGGESTDAYDRGRWR